MTASIDERDRTSALRHAVPETSRTALAHESVDAETVDWTLSGR